VSDETKRFLPDVENNRTLQGLYKPCQGGHRYRQSEISEDAIEGMTAFAQKRPPPWKNR
jgi:hypothetical protein